jgi:hypothetical protein
MTKEIDKATRDLNNILEQRESLFHRAKVLSKNREAVAFAAHTGDKAAKAKLADINLEDIRLGSDIASVEAALTVARQNLAIAQQGEAVALDKANALALRDKLAKFVELGMILDDCFVDFRTAALEMAGGVIDGKRVNGVLDDIHALGQSTPTAMQFKVNADLAFKTAVQGTPFWSQEFPALGHGQKKTFKSLVEAWSANIEANIAARLGENKSEAA